MLRLCSFPAYIGNADMIQPDLAPLQPSLDDMEISGKRAPDIQWHRKNSMCGTGYCGARAQHSCLHLGQSRGGSGGTRPGAVKPSQFVYSQRKDNCFLQERRKPLESRLCVGVSPPHS